MISFRENFFGNEMNAIKKKTGRTEKKNDGSATKCERKG